jgi:hypothetical protein
MGEKNNTFRILVGKHEKENTSSKIKGSWEVVEYILKTRV